MMNIISPFYRLSVRVFDVESTDMNHANAMDKLCAAGLLLVRDCALGVADMGASFP